MGWNNVGQFVTVVADPPWPYDAPTAVVGNGGRGSQDGRAANIIQTNVETHYKTMSIQDLCRLPVVDHVEDNAHLYLWTTNSFIVEAHTIARAWGFVPKTIITWVKIKKDGSEQASMKTGYWFRSATEHCLFAVRGKLRLAGPAMPTVFFHPRLPHSVKPDQFFTDIVEVQSPGKSLELFARKPRNGWTVWGDEVESGFSL